MSVAVPVTRGPRQHFFGYYDKFPWDATGRYMLALETNFMDRPPRAEDKAVIGLIDLRGGNRFTPLDETFAWCWQQGAMLQWLGTAPERLIVYNQRVDGCHVSIVRDVESGQTRTLPLPVYAVSRDGRSAVCVNYARIARTRPGYGYAGLDDPFENEGAPAGDGVWLMDMQSGAHRLVISIEQMARTRPLPSMAGAKHRIKHLQFNPDGTRFLFLHRWQAPGAPGFLTRMYTAGPDGSDIHYISGDEMVSHFDWKSPTEILAWARYPGTEARYRVYTDGSEKSEVLGEGVLTVDGHCSYSPNGRWLLTDTYPDAERMRTLILYRLADGRRIDLGRFFAPQELDGEIRCDLHPRWSRDGRQVCIDSVHEGSRQMYVLDVAALVAE